jgi:hypothetical protein
MYKEAEMRRIHESSGISAQFLTMTIHLSAPFRTGSNSDAFGCAGRW